MWCYSLRFPRIRRVKMNSSFMDCLTFQDLQGMGRNSISATSSEVIHEPLIDETYIHKPQKRVRFVFDAQEGNQEIKQEKLMKSDYYIHLSKRIKLADRERLINWLEFRGFELIWSYEAAIQFSDRKIIYVTHESDDAINNEKISMKIPWNRVEIDLQVENAYFRIQRT